MATTPYFVISPNALLSLIGFLHGPDRTVPTPPEDWHDAVVDVVIPAFNEERNIVHCLASVANQTMKPRQVILIDDGSYDNTCEEAEAFAKRVGMKLTVIHRQTPIGKTPTIKRQSREFDSDVEFILDGDTFLESDNYIARAVEELYKGAGIASACGTILPMRAKDRDKVARTPVFQKFAETNPREDLFGKRGPLHLLWWAITNLYRETLYVFLQRFVYQGQMVFFGGITNPVGCAVAYRRKYIKNLFDRYEPIFGDDLTNSEDIFIGFALNNEGYRNIQLMDVLARSEEPEVQRLPRQVYLWSSSFLQSCYYFDDLMRSPLKGFARLRKRWKDKHDPAMQEILNKRKIQEAYRQAFGIEVTKRYGRPIGWIIFTSALEKIAFPTTFLIMIILQLWEPLLLTVAIESALSTGILMSMSPWGSSRLVSLWKALLVIPIRYTLLLYELVTIGRFATDLWITRNRKWRK